MAALEPASAPQAPGAHACGAARPALELTHRRNLSRLSKRFLLAYGNRQARWAPPAEPVICFPGLFLRMRYQMVLSLSGFLSTEILQNLLNKVDCIRNHLRCAPDRISRGDIFVGGTYEDDCPWGCFSVLCRTGQRYLLIFLEPGARCNIWCSQCLHSRHLLGMRGVDITL